MTEHQGATHLTHPMLAPHQTDLQRQAHENADHAEPISDAQPYQDNNPLPDNSGQMLQGEMTQSSHMVAGSHPESNGEVPPGPSGLMQFYEPVYGGPPNAGMVPPASTATDDQVMGTPAEILRMDNLQGYISYIMSALSTSSLHHALTEQPMSNFVLERPICGPVS